MLRLLSSRAVILRLDMCVYLRAECILYSAIHSIMTFSLLLNDQECNEVKTHVCAGKERSGREEHEEVGGRDFTTERVVLTNYLQCRCFSLL